jgi:hypothetical protein
MLLEDAANLRAALAQHQALKAVGLQEKVFRTRASQLTPLAEGLSRAQRDWTALAKAGLPVSRSAPKPALRARAEELLERFRVDRSVLAAADETFRFEFTSGVRNAAEELEAEASKAWASYMAEGGGFPSEEVLTALAAIPSYAKQVQRIREAAGDFRRLAQHPPAAADVADALAQVDGARRKKDDALSAMKSDDLPAEVLIFLRKTGQGGAALSDLTDVVRRWLDARGLVGAFRITPSHPT